jgi:hypothetical protein
VVYAVCMLVANAQDIFCETSLASAAQRIVNATGFGYKRRFFSTEEELA